MVRASWSFPRAPVPNRQLGMIKSGAFVIAAAAGADMLPVRIIYGTKDGKMHLFCKIRIVFGEAIPCRGSAN